MGIVTLGQRRRIVVAFVLALVAVSVAAPTSAATRPSPPDLYVPPPDQGARRQIADLRSEQDKEAAGLIQAMIDTPQAVWFTAGTPPSVVREVRATVARAAAKRSVPVLVAYNIPFRDCAQFSAGGATHATEYEAWIDGFAAGIGDREVDRDPRARRPGHHPVVRPLRQRRRSERARVVPAGRGRPGDCGRRSFRHAELRRRRARRAAQRDVLPRRHAQRLARSRRHRRSPACRPASTTPTGFFLNVSNYQFTTQQRAVRQLDLGLHRLRHQGHAGDFFGCPNQYWNGGPLPAKIAELLGEWTGVALDRFGEWSDDVRRPDPQHVGDQPALREHARDRRAHGPLRDRHQPQRCRAVAAARLPGRAGLVQPARPRPGPAPDADTGDPLVDAYLWVKIPGESDGECTRGLGPAGKTVDPEWGRSIPPPATGSRRWRCSWRRTPCRRYVRSAADFLRT